MASAAEKDEKPFRLLDLPAELRLRIYEEALTAPDRSIKIYYSYQKNRVPAGLALSLLQTSRQVHKEARDILYQANTVLLHADVNVTSHPVIHSAQVPAAALARLESVFVVLDASDSHAFGYERVDFRPFQLMKKLRCLRVAVVSQPQYPDALAFWTGLLGFVVERVPAGCTLLFGSSNEVEKTYTARYCHSWRSTLNIVEVPGEVLMRAAGYCRCEKGAKSGSTTDWRDGSDDDQDELPDGPRTW